MKGREGVGGGGTAASVGNEADNVDTVNTELAVKEFLCIFSDLSLPVLVLIEHAAEWFPLHTCLLH